jgi:hypothetical protein
LRIVIGYGTAESLQFILLQLIQSSLEIIEDDRVRETFEDECKFPEGIDAIR